MNEQQHIDLITTATTLQGAAMAELATRIANATSSVTEYNLVMATGLTLMMANAAAFLDICIQPGNAVMVAKVKGILRRVQMTEDDDPIARERVMQSLDRLVYLTKHIGGDA